MRAQISQLEGELSKAHLHIERLNSLVEREVKSSGDTGRDSTGLTSTENTTNQKEFFDKIYSTLDDIKSKNDDKNLAFKHRSSRADVRRFIDKIRDFKVN